MRFIVLIIITLTLVLAGCGHSTADNAVKSSDIVASSAQKQTSHLTGSTPRGKPMSKTYELASLDVELPSFKMTEFMFETNEGITVHEDELKAILAEFDVPVTMTPRVQYYVKYFTGPGKSSMQRWIDRSNYYMYIVRDTFRKEDVPQDLIVLSFTESGFNPVARSKAGATGMWQFMRATGKMYGLEVNEWVDHRRDFEKSTVAAARHLRDLYNTFDDWYLALAAYNAGSGRISRATKQHNTKDFFTIATTRTLKLETRDYVPKYLAQLIIYKHMIEYGFTPPSELPLLFDTVEVVEPVNLFVVANLLGVTHEEMKTLNPELLTPMTPPVSSYTLRVPAGKKDTMVAYVNDKKTDLARYKIYKAKSGESLARIAKQYGTTTAAIKKVNSYNYDNVYTSKILFIPKQDTTAAIDTAFAKEIATLAPKYYTVRKGDNMTLISKKHNMPLNVLVQLNPKVKPSKIYPGQVLVISRGGLG